MYYGEPLVHEVHKNVLFVYKKEKIVHVGRIWCILRGKKRLLVINLRTHLVLYFQPNSFKLFDISVILCSVLETSFFKFCPKIPKVSVGITNYWVRGY